MPVMEIFKMLSSNKNRRLRPYRQKGIYFFNPLNGLAYKLYIVNLNTGSLRLHRQYSSNGNI